MHKTGKTPLLRARKLEKLFDVGEIYIKLEGTNPSGHKHDRIAEVLVKDAVARGSRTIIADGSASYLRSIMYFAGIEGVDVTIPVFKNEQWKNRKFKNDTLVKMKHPAGENPIDILKQYTAENSSYLAVEGHSSTHLSQTALEGLTEEIAKKLDYKIDNIFTQLSYGYTLTSIYSSMLKFWIENRIDRLPRVICGTWENGNSVYEYYKKTNDIRQKSITKAEEDETIINPVLMDRQLLEESFLAVIETNGEIQSVDREFLKESVQFLRKHEHIKVSMQEGYAFASFYHMVKTGAIEKGRHVIILNDARSALTIENLNDYDELSKEKLINFTRKWLAQYSDSVLETEEAIQNAMEKGFILLASRNDNYEGICIVVNMGYDHFHPKYHLAYVGTDSTSKGRGVATELIQQAIDLSDGSISLHVDLDNKGAKKLYEKLGFKHYYNRMIYNGNA